MWGGQDNPSGGLPRRQSPTRPPYLSDEEWRQYLELFNRAPLSANHMLVEIEIERNLQRPPSLLLQATLPAAAWLAAIARAPEGRQPGGLSASSRRDSRKGTAKRAGS